MPRHHITAKQRQDNTRVSNLMFAFDNATGQTGLGSPFGPGRHRRDQALSSLSPSQRGIFDRAVTESRNVSGSRSQNLTTSHPVGGGSITSGAGAVTQQSEAGLASLRGLQSEQSTPLTPHRRNRSGPLSPRADDNVFSRLMESVVSQSQARHERSNTSEALAGPANERAAFVGRVSTSQRDARAINKLVQSGKRRVRGASVALPRTARSPKRSLLR